MTFLFVQSVAQPGTHEILKAAGLAALLYVIVILHECGHAVVALGFGLGPIVMRIHALGGSTSYVRANPSPGREAAIAAAGPAVTAVLAFVMRAVQLNSDGSTSDLFGFLYSACVVLTIFNLLPGLPLDGGAIVKSIAWAITKDERRATRFAAGAGVLLAVGLAVIGVWGYVHTGDRVFALISLVLAITIGAGAYRTWQVFAPSTESLRPSVFDARVLLAQQSDDEGTEPEQPRND